MIQVEPVTPVPAPAPPPPHKPTHRGTPGTRGHKHKQILRSAWLDGVKNVRLSQQQTRDLEALYQPRDPHGVINASSLGAALSSPTLSINEAAIEAVSDDAHSVGDCQCSWPALSNHPVLYKQATEHVEPF